MRASLVLLFTAIAYGQTPQITPGGVVSGASWASPIAPGELISIFGSDFGSASGTTVTVNGVAAQVLFVLPTQINAVVPASLATIATPNLAAAVVVVTTPAGSSRGEVAALAVSAPGFFTLDGSGCGQVAALNVAPGGALSVNSPGNSAAPGDYVAIYGTGFGTASPALLLDGNPLPLLSYAGPAPGLAGLEQINFQIPATTRNGCNVPVFAAGFWGGPTVTLSVQASRGKCVDPPVKSYGNLLLTKAMTLAAASPSGASEFFTAFFPAAPNAQPTATEQILFAPDWGVATGGITVAILSPAPVYPRSCTVPGYRNLSAGTIQIQPPSGTAAAITPSSALSYGSVLPEGFIGPGTYTFTGAPGSAVALNATLNVGSPIQLQTGFAPGTAISLVQPPTIRWTGGEAGALVRVGLTSEGVTDYSYAPAAAGSITIPHFDLPLSTNAQITVSVVPAQPTVVSVPGVTGLVQLTWSYVYSFSGLTLTN